MRERERVCVCVCVCEREREREREGVCRVEREVPLTAEVYRYITSIYTFCEQDMAVCWGGEEMPAELVSSTIDKEVTPARWSLQHTHCLLQHTHTHPTMAILCRATGRP